MVRYSVKVRQENVKLLAAIVLVATQFCAPALINHPRHIFESLKHCL